MRPLLILATLFATANAFAALEPHYQDIKLPTQQMVEKQSWAAPIAARSTFVMNGMAGPTSSAALTISSGFSTATMDFARNLILQGSGSTFNAQASCAVVVSGTDYLNHSISETLTIPAGSSSVVTGSKAFYTVASVAFPAGCIAAPNPTINYYLGVGVKLGLKRCMADAGGWFHSTTSGTKDVTAATIAADASVVSLNTIQTNSAPNASRNFDAYFMQNFACVR